jgi:hypothetical protein
MKKIKQEPEKVIVVWKGSSEPGSYGVLSFRDGPRVYYRDRLDPRSGDLPYVATIAELNAREGIGSAHAVQLPVSEAVKAGLISEREGGCVNA